MRFRRKQKKQFGQKQPGVSTGTWCSQAIRPDAEVFGLGAKTRPGDDLKEYEGKTMPLPLHVEGKIVPAIVAPSKSQAKIEGNDIVFMISSQDCGEALREAVKEEIEIIEEIGRL